MAHFPYAYKQVYIVKNPDLKEEESTSELDPLEVGFHPKFEKGKTHLLRIDIKGSPALRTMQRNLYRVFDAGPDCVDTCHDPCDAPLLSDPLDVMIRWSEQINNDPIFSRFVQARAYMDIGMGLVQYYTSDNYTPTNNPTNIDGMVAGWN